MTVLTTSASPSLPDARAEAQRETRLLVVLARPLRELEILRPHPEVRVGDVEVHLRRIGHGRRDVLDFLLAALEREGSALVVVAETGVAERALEGAAALGLEHRVQALGEEAIHPRLEIGRRHVVEVLHLDADVVADQLPGVGGEERAVEASARCLLRSWIDLFDSRNVLAMLRVGISPS